MLRQKKTDNDQFYKSNSNHKFELIFKVFSFLDHLLL